MKSRDPQQPKVPLVFLIRFLWSFTKKVSCPRFFLSIKILKRKTGFFFKVTSLDLRKQPSTGLIRSPEVWANYCATRGSRARPTLSRTHHGREAIQGTDWLLRPMIPEKARHLRIYQFKASETLHSSEIVKKESQKLAIISWIQRVNKFHRYRWTAETSAFQRYRKKC